MGGQKLEGTRRRGSHVPPTMSPQEPYRPLPKDEPFVPGDGKRRYRAAPSMTGWTHAFFPFDSRTTARTYPSSPLMS